MLRDKLKGRKEKEYIDAIENLRADNLSNRAIKALENQAEYIVKYLEGTSLVLNMEDKDDKTFDRGKMFLKDLPDLVKRIQDLKVASLNLEDKTSIRKEAADNSIIGFLEQEDR